MFKNQIAIAYLVRKLHYRYNDGDPKKDLHIEQLRRILWFSYPIVYGGDMTHFPQIQRAIENRKAKVKRTRRYIYSMAQCFDELYFVTLTWTDDVLSSTTERTRHRYVQSFLNLHTRDYYANVDYGEKNDREHYHAVVAWNHEIPCPVWQYGHYEYKKIRLNYGSKSISKISKYVNKIVLHANKLTCGKSFHKRGLISVDSLPF